MSSASRDTGEGQRPGEVWLDGDPAEATADAGLVFIGRVRSAWRPREGATPRNPGEARRRKEPASIVIEPPYRAALQGLAGYSHVWVLVWLDRASRRPLVITPPNVATPTGIFALRSPVRPNPIGLSAARILCVDEAEGRIEVDAIDFLDGTPVIDVKPYRPGIDAMPDAVVG
jgi:tRNA-Thr(GGU) m(6)t(6)A37 methyltransferase TsaA